MRTLVAGTAFVALTYMAQTAVVATLWGPAIAIGYLVSLPVAADINFYLSDRLHRALHRARAFIRFRRDRELQERLRDELRSLREDVQAFDRALGAELSVPTA